VFSAAPLKKMEGPTYTVDVKFSTDLVPAMTGAPLPAGGGDAGKAFTAFLGAITKKDWPGIKAGLSSPAVPNHAGGLLRLFAPVKDPASIARCLATVGRRPSIPGYGEPGQFDG